MVESVPGKVVENMKMMIPLGRAGKAEGTQLDTLLLRPFTYVYVNIIYIIIMYIQCTVFNVCNVVHAEIAETCLFLASDQSSYITGATFEVTGVL